jgi:Tol biopolymer transport system component
MALRHRPHTLLCLVVLLAAGVAPHLEVRAQQGQQAPPPARKLVIIDRAGKQTVLGEVPGTIWGPRVSPDGTRLAFTVTGRTRAEDALYVGPLMNPAQMRRIGPGRNAYWSHDGTRLFFSGAGTEILLWRRVEGDDKGEQLVTPARAPESRSPDGRILSYVQSLDDRFTGWTLDLTTRTRTQIPGGDAEVLGTNISTDGRWIAYESARPGQSEVYVQPLGRPGPAVLVAGKGYRPVWSADMREMFFDDGTRQLFVVGIRTEPTFALAGAPVPLPIKGFVQNSGRRLYDLLPDGRFVMVFP